MRQIFIYDTTLREGAQCTGLWLTVNDRLRILKMLDDIGVHFVEGGNPGAGEKEHIFFEEASKLKLQNTHLVAFGSTHRHGVLPEEDPALRSLLEARTEYVCIFGKAWRFHIDNVLKVDEDENLRMIEETIEFLRSYGKKVIFDAEHFFDGYKEDPEFSIKVLRCAKAAGAESFVLCDTNGGCFPDEIQHIVSKVNMTFPDMPLGIHCHNDTGMADANTISAVLAGATMVQATLDGLGERCGNANLITTIANLSLKREYQTIPADKISMLTEVSQKFHSIGNVSGDPLAPYVGKNAFAHKAGMHIDGVLKAPSTFEHINPALVGGRRVTVLSDIAGKKAMAAKVHDLFPDVREKDFRIEKILEIVKEKELHGYSFSGADASLDLLVLKALGGFTPHFHLVAFKVMVEEPHTENAVSLATVEIEVDHETALTAAHGNGPVNALDAALRKALERFYPMLNEMYLTDFKVRVIDSQHATASEVRVIIESRDADSVWSTVGVSSDIINASWIALVDSIEYKLHRSKGIL